VKTNRPEGGAKGKKPKNRRKNKRLQGRREKGKQASKKRTLNWKKILPKTQKEKKERWRRGKNYYPESLKRNLVIKT